MMDTFLDSCLFSLLLLPLHFNFLCYVLISFLIFPPPPPPSLSFLFHHLPFHHALSPSFSSLPFILPFFSLYLQREFWKRENEWVGGEGWVSIRAAASSFHVVTNITQRLTGGKIHWLNINKRSWDLDRLPYPKSDTGKNPPPPPRLLRRTEIVATSDLFWVCPFPRILLLFSFFLGVYLMMMEDNLLEFIFQEKSFQTSMMSEITLMLIVNAPRLKFSLVTFCWLYRSSLYSHAAVTSKSSRSNKLFLFMM